MGEWILNVLRTGGYPGLVGLSALECVFPPIPSELIFPLAGYLAQQGDLTLVGITLAGGVGATAGSLPLYLLGRKIGDKRLRDFLAKHCRWTAVSQDDMDRASGWFKRRGAMAVLLAHLVPGIRSLIAFPAGVNAMSLWAFLGLTFLGSAAWAGALATAGYFLRSRFTEIERYLDPITWAVLGGVAAAYVWRIVKQRRRA